jgi:hypothetical protein
MEVGVALREFTDGDGEEWRVWLVTPTSGGWQALAEAYRGGWLCFERADGSDRRRLSLADAPASWDALPDDHLERLRRAAEVVPRRPTPGDGPAVESVAGSLENEQRSRVSGPRSVVGEDDKAVAP